VTDPDISAYESLAELGGDARWAFGTGFIDALDGVSTELPAGVDRADLAAYCLMLGDDALVASQRLIEWCTKAPELEEEVALANIALDLLGQARLLYGRAGFAEDAGRDEDALAYLRDAEGFRNVWLVEQPNGDFAVAIAGLFLTSTWRLALMERLRASDDPVLAAIAGKAVKELSYHRDYAARWVVRLGDGTELSHRRMADGLAAVWPFLDELFASSAVEARLAGIAVDPSGLRAAVDAVLDQVLAAATLERPSVQPADGGGREGRHSEHLAPLLAEMQEVARAHEGATW
jgi:ring-1,2-phenylacetyl-CoA epoxidase subunit PaaC